MNCILLYFIKCILLYFLLFYELYLLVDILKFILLHYLPATRLREAILLETLVMWRIYRFQNPIHFKITIFCKPGYHVLPFFSL